MQLQGERLQLGTFPIAVDDLGRDLMALHVVRRQLEMDGNGVLGNVEASVK